MYNIPTTEKIKGGVEKMCNFSSGIKEQAMAKGLAEGREKGLAEGRAEGELIGQIKAMHIYSDMSAEEVAAELNCPIEYVIEVFEGLNA